jgi:hypothetical protein
MIRIILTAVSSLIFVTSCAASPERPTPDTEPANPSEPPRIVTQNDLALSLTIPQRVLVVYGEIGEEGSGTECPVRVSTISNVCQERGFQNSDTSVVCRRTGPDEPEPGMRRIRWVATNAEREFEITFGPTDCETCEEIEPCSNTWPNEQQTCLLKNANYFKAIPGRAAYVKYTIQDTTMVGEEYLCPALDPFFIVRH